MDLPFDKDADRGEDDPGLSVPGEALVFLAQEAVGGEPGEGALDDPTAGLHDEALGACGAAHDLQVKRGPVLRNPDGQRAGVVDGVGPDFAQGGEAMASLRQQQFRPHRVGDVGRMHQHGEQVALRVNEQMPFAPLGFFSPGHSRWRR